MKILTTFCFTLILAAAAHAQNSYGVTKATALSGTAEVITVQGNGTNDVLNRLPKVISFVSVDVTCTVACTFTLERDGTAATTTTLAIVQTDKILPTTTAVAFSASNVGSGTVLGNYSLTAGGGVGIGLAGKNLYNAADNLSIRTSSITGTVTINIRWNEK